MRIIRALLTRTHLYPAAHGEQLPVITVPVALENRVREIVRNQKIDDERERINTIKGGNRNTPVISCKRKHLNYFLNQEYSRFETMPLTSKGWHNRKSVGDFFTIQQHGPIPSFKYIAGANKDDKPNQIKFEDLGIQSDIVANLRNMGICIPTNIQTLAIPEILQDSNVLCSSETGNGKTLAYLLPLLSKMINNAIYKNKPQNSPSSLIIVPTYELVKQVTDVSNKVIGNLPLRVESVFGKVKPYCEEDISSPREQIDIMVATVGALRSKVKKEIYNMNYVKHVVLDEVDTLLDDSFNEELRSFLVKFVFHEDIPAPDQIQRGLVQLIMVGATLPHNANRSLEGVVNLNSVVKVSTDFLHRILPHIPQTFLRLSNRDRKIKLLEFVKKDVQKNKPVIIFTRKSTTCDWMRMELEENGVKCVNFNADLPMSIRKQHYKRFSEEDCLVMVATDLASRGLDFSHVQHVINYDMPDCISDYIHRVGRVGRVGSKAPGHVTNFVTAPWEISVTQAIEQSVRNMMQLPNVDANIKRRLEARFEMKELNKNKK